MIDQFAPLRLGRDLARGKLEPAREPQATIILARRVFDGLALAGHRFKENFDDAAIEKLVRGTATPRRRTPSSATRPSRTRSSRSSPPAEGLEQLSRTTLGGFGR
ncbi:hypothetical protein [Kitasatospora sp. HPMI-4]|uniref:hypothetical protein n=1 Tax=Kitasatospora sp. HPMI-4 TaxID=3448443 RepID=UPI003F1E03D2